MEGVFRIVDLLFGCHHRHLSFPISSRGPVWHPPHVVCLDCGRSFVYDWDEMRIVRHVEPKESADTGAAGDSDEYPLFI